jgi:acyl CoA:acetate/3-ketoacid CoA transferase alpha subunit
VAGGASEAVAASARSGEPDRYLAALLAPPSARTHLLALAAFSSELARVPLLVTREPAMGQIRLQWWRDALEAPQAGARTGNPIADAVRDAMQRCELPAALLRDVIEAREMDEGLLQWGLKAAGMRVPFLPTRVGLGTDVMTMNPEFRTVRSPYDDGEVLLAMPAIELDAALVHVDRADRLGNTQTLGPDPYFDEHYARASKSCYVTCEELVDRLDLSHPEDARLNQFERYFVSGVVHAPFGAHPTSNPPSYGWDLEHLKRYTAAAGEDNGWETYAAEFLAGTEDDYRTKVGGRERLAKLPLPVF